MNRWFSLAETQPEVSTLIVIVTWAAFEVQAGAKGIPNRNWGMPIVSNKANKNRRLRLKSQKKNRLRIFSRNFPYVKINRFFAHDSASSTSPTAPAAASGTETPAWLAGKYRFFADFQGFNSWEHPWTKRGSLQQPMLLYHVWLQETTRGYSCFDWFWAVPDIHVLFPIYMFCLRECSWYEKWIGDLRFANAAKSYCVAVLFFGSWT